MSNSTAKELHLQQLYNEKIENIMKHIENEKKTLEKFHKGKCEKTDKTKNALKEDMRKKLFQNISKEIMEKNGKMKNQFSNSNYMYADKESPNPEMDISKFNYPKYNTHTFLKAPNGNMIFNNIQGNKSHANKLQFPYHLYKKNSQPIVNHPILVQNGMARRRPQEPIQESQYRKGSIQIMEEKAVKNMALTEEPFVAKESIIPIKKKYNTDVSGLIHAYKEYKQQEEEKKKKEMEEELNREERKMCNWKMVHSHKQNETCEIKEEMFSNKSTRKQIIKEKKNEEIKKDFLSNEIMIQSSNNIQVPLHMEVRSEFACVNKNPLFEKCNKNMFERVSTEIIKNRKNNISIEQETLENQKIPNKCNIFRPIERSMSSKTFFNIMEKHKKEMNFNQLNFNYVQNNNVDIHINHGYPSNQLGKGKTNIHEKKYINGDLLKERLNLYEQPIHGNIKFDELVYMHHIEMEKKRSQQNYEKYSHSVSNDLKHPNEWMDSNVSPLVSKEKATECLRNDNSSESSYKTYNTIVYNNECKRAYMQRENEKSILSNKTTTEEGNHWNKEEQFRSHHCMASAISNNNKNNLKQKEMMSGVNRKREEINFLSNNDLSSFDITNTTNIIDQKQYANYNDIIFLDIEEKKTNKLFFEEICVYRMNERSDSQRFNQTTPIYLFKDKSLNELALEKLEIHKKHYKDINDEIKKLIPQEDVYEVEMNVGLLFRKFVPVTMSLSCKYLLIQKNENNLITCISYRNITKIEMVKKNDAKRIYLFKLVYIFKKKKEKTEKNVTLLFRTNKSEMFDKIKNKVHPLLMLDTPEKDFLDIETVYAYIIQKYKTVHALYLKHLLQNVEKIIRKNLYRQCFNALKMKYALSKKAEQITIKKKKKLQQGFIKMENCLKKIGKKYFQLLIMKSYEHSLVNYQVKTNNLLYEMLTKEKTAYQENLEKQNAFLLCSILSVFYKRKMREYFDIFTKNSRIFHRGKEAFVYVITHVNSIFSKYENRNKNYVLNLLRFDYDRVSQFSFALYKLYLRRVLSGYLAIRDNLKRRKFLTQKHVLHLVKVLTKVVDHMKHYAFTKIQKHVYEEKERKNVLLLDSLVSANNELCNNLDKVAIEKGINKIECLYKFKIKECLVKFFFKLRGPQINNGSFSHCIKHCSIFIFVLNKIAYRKIQKHFFHFILKCLQDNNTNRLIYSMKKLETVIEKKEKRNVLELLKFYEEYPYLFKYRHLTKIEVFTNSVTNFIVIYNRKLMLNFFLKLHYIKYQGQVIKAYTCIGNIYKLVKVLNHKMHNHLLESFEKLVLNAREKRFKMLEEECKEKKNRISSLNKISFKDNKNAYKKMNYSSDDISPEGYKFMKKYPLLFHNSNVASEYTTTLTDDKWSMKSNDSITHSLSHTYDDMDQIKKKICSFNTKISKMK